MAYAIYLAALAVIFVWVTPAYAKPPIEAFSDYPEIRSADMSPDGRSVVYLKQDGDDTYVVLYNLDEKTEKALANVGKLRPRYAYFAGNKHVVAVVSRRSADLAIRYHWEASAAFSINIETRKMAVLLDKTKGLYGAQTGLGRIIGVSADGQSVFMPAFMEAEGSEPPTFDVLKVDLDTGRGERIPAARGDADTVGWLVDRQGQPIMQELYSERANRHEVKVRENGKWRTLFVEPAKEEARHTVLGVTPSGTSLVTAIDAESEFLSLYEVSLKDGAITGPTHLKQNADVEAVVSDRQNVFQGVRYSGMRPSYELADRALQSDIEAVQAAMAGAAVSIAGWSDNWSRVLLLIEGGVRAETYAVLDRSTKTLSLIANGRPALAESDIGEVVTIEYKARDGLTIPAVLTWPARVPADQRKSLPIVMLPHGGPEAYDSVSFDWLAQFLANEGYLVMQPNFRGSSGFGSVFEKAGHGQWGRKMQDDVTDGLTAMVATGWADPSRACIMGWSFGGYSALAGGALTPDLYKCVVSVAGVSDPRDMLESEKRQNGEDSFVYEYWTKLIGDQDKDRAAIDAVAPVRLAANFKSPVLLLHGTNDSVVPVRQSDRMADALRNQNKPVTYRKFAGDNHSLIETENRRETLAAVSDFLAKHIGPSAAGKASTE